MKLSLPAALIAVGLLVTSIAAVRFVRPHPVALTTSARSAVHAPRHIVFASLPPARLAALHADEAGRIPILMYHSIGAPSRKAIRYDSQGLNIAPETFRKQLALMYAAHWYPMNMRDILTSHMNVPAGKTPVVLTFDDARGSQFHYLSDGTIDPNCAVGILEAFHKTHKGWPLRATFYVLPKSAWNPVPFWQPGRETKKLRTLVADGFEVANHTTTHRLMTHLSAPELTWEMAECQRYVRDRAPRATMDTMALPGGAAPKNHALWNLLLRGRLGKIAYHNRCILMAWGGPSRSWADKKFDPDRITRIGTGPGWVERAITRLKTGRIREYVSDGNPDTVAVPRLEAALVDSRRLDGARLVVYGNGGIKAAVAVKKTGPKVGRKPVAAGKPA
ncbi:MAG: polysaccharide deacetylase family protein [Armatimonadota bacterium]|nr:polysaccharide deacetylase family protein [Armatimonadota bacterium]